MQFASTCSRFVAGFLLSCLLVGRLAHGNGSGSDFQISTRSVGCEEYLIGVKGEVNDQGRHKSGLDLEKILDGKSIAGVKVVRGQIDFLIFPNGKKIELGEMIGEGDFGVVYCLGSSCKSVIKLPIDRHGGFTFSALEKELDNYEKFKKTGIGAPKVRPIYSRDEGGNKRLVALVKEFVDFGSFKNTVETKQNPQLVISRLRDLYIKLKENNLKIDLNVFGNNLVWDSRYNHWVVLDAGRKEGEGAWRIPGLEAWRLWFDLNYPGLSGDNGRFFYEQFIEIAPTHIRFRYFRNAIKSEINTILAVAKANGLEKPSDGIQHGEYFIETASSLSDASTDYIDYKINRTPQEDSIYRVEFSMKKYGELSKWGYSISKIDGSKRRYLSEALNWVHLTEGSNEKIAHFDL
ncbi:MAG: hypothetical protein AB1540_14905 [Bdellovibrionota bacterium]